MLFANVMRRIIARTVSRWDSHGEDVRLTRRHIKGDRARGRRSVFKLR
jgi:hypothetical protein